ncbi:MAG: hypothetical protein MUD08_12815 [Cytophagales bacterium]|jgi:uncharacterized membrane protein YphA (DoxX/SURF4 family)|nr:hypothetical protein [Cytophagales bacterium]
MQTTLTETLPSTVAWTTAEKILFRFCCVFFVLYVVINNNGVVPLADWISGFTTEPLLHALIPWMGKHILQLSKDITVFTNGSGDTTYDYVLVLFIFVLAVAGCAVWSVLDRNRRDYQTAYYWLTVVVRYYVGLTMLTYGFVKVFKLQFPFPSVATLAQPYGESTPMRLAWTFMGYSKLYNYFTGFAEVLGGALLLFRRTAALGALVSLMVMLNVAVMNFSFDIPVKLLSSTVVVMCVFLLARDAWKLYAFFVLHRPTALSVVELPTFRKKWVRIGGRVFKYAFVVAVVGMNIYGGFTGLDSYGDSAPKPPLYGIYYAESHIRNNDTVPPLATDTLRWKRLIVGKYGRASVQFMNDTLRTFTIEPDTLKKTFVLISNKDTAQKHTFAYKLPDRNHLLLSGTWKGDSISVRFRKKDVKEFPLVSTGFNWINEYPNNR